MASNEFGVQPVLKNVWKQCLRYWQLPTLLIVLLAAAVCQGLGQELAAKLILGIGSGLLTLVFWNDFWQQLRARRYGFDFLALVATYDALSLRRFWLAAAIVAVTLVSKQLVTVAGRAARREAGRWQQRQAATTQIIRGRKTAEISAAAVRAGDKLRIAAGEIVPVEAVILEGSSSFDEVLPAGGEAPVSKAPGEQLASGSRNRENDVIVRALSSVADSQYQQILKIIRSASAQPAPFVRQAERFGWFFSALALAIAGSAWWWHHQASRFLEVIVAAAPGPLLVAPSVAVLAGIYRAGQSGIIFRTGSSFERLAAARTFAFAKTGIITSAVPTIDTVTVAKPYSRPELLGLAASVTAAADQPLAAAIVAASGGKSITVSKVKHLKTAADGTLSASLKGYRLLLGRPEALTAAGIAIPPAGTAKQTALYIAINDQFAGSISFLDEPVATAKPLLKTLRQLGIKATLLFGSDSEPALKQIAKKAGIGDVCAAATPGARLHALEKLQDRPVVFVGDGLRDAPLLTTADVGLALGARGSAPAGEAADVILLESDLRLVARAVTLSRRSFDAARLSLAGGTLLSLGLMIGFAIGHVSPWIGVGLPLVITILAVVTAAQAVKQAS